MVKDDISRLRKKVDEIDDEMVDLLSKRVDSAREIIRLKVQAGMAKEDLQREREIVKRLKKKFDHKLVDEIYASIFKEINSW